MTAALVPETYFTVHEELVLFGLSCLLGGAMGLVFDVLRAVRLLLPHNTLLVVIEDVLFLGLWGLALSAFTSAAVRGELHLYYLLGSGTGFTLYLLTLGSVVSGTIRKLMQLLRGLLEALLRPVKRAFVAFGQWTGGKFVGFAEVIVKHIKKVGLLLLNSAHLMYNKRESKKRKNVGNVVRKKEKNLRRGRKERTVQQESR